MQPLGEGSSKAPSHRRFDLERFIRWGIVTTLVLCSALWVVFYIMLRREAAEDQAYYDQHVRPAVEYDRAQSEAFEKALQDRSNGIATPLPKQEFTASEPLSLWIDRKTHRSPDYHEFMFFCQMGFILTGMVGAVIVPVLSIRRAKLRATPDRPADQHAGLWIEGYKSAGHVIVSRPRPGNRWVLPLGIVAIGGLGGAMVGYVRKGGQPSDPQFVLLLLVGLTPFACVGALLYWIDRRRKQHSLEIDPVRGIVTFRNFKFTKAFTDNKAEAVVELAFKEILGTSITTHQGTVSMVLRTTRGKITLDDRFEHFDEVATVLTDCAEVNRKDPEGYREALAREPVVRTPWYVWFIILGAVGAVATAFWYFVLR